MSFVFLWFGVFYCCFGLFAVLGGAVNMAVQSLSLAGVRSFPSAFAVPLIYCGGLPIKQGGHFAWWQRWEELVRACPAF